MTATRPAYSLRQFAKRLGVSPGKVRGWIDRGELIAYDLRGPGSDSPRFRILAGDADAFLRGRAVTTDKATGPALARRRSARRDLEVIQFH